MRTLNKQCVRMGSPYLSHTVSIHWVKRSSVFGTVSSPIIAKLHKWNDMKSSIDPVVVNPSLLYLPITTGFMYIPSANLAMHSSVVFMRNINRNHLHQITKWEGSGSVHSLFGQVRLITAEYTKFRYDNPKFLWISVQGCACRRSPNCWACGLSPVGNLKCAMAEQMGASCFSKSGATKVDSKCVLFHPETNAFGYPNFEKHSNVILPK